MSNNKQPNSEKKQYAMRDSADKPCVVVLLQRALSDIETFKSNDTISRRIATIIAKMENGAQVSVNPIPRSNVIRSVGLGSNDGFILVVKKGQKNQKPVYWICGICSNYSTISAIEMGKREKQVEELQKMLCDGAVQTVVRHNSNKSPYKQGRQNG